MVALNLLRLAITWRAYRTDGMEQIGFPFAFFERGGLSYREDWHVHLLAADVAIALAFAIGFAHVLRDGWSTAFYRFQNWGLNPSSESAESPCEASEVDAPEQRDQ